MEALLVYVALAIVISVITIKHDRKTKKIAEGYNPYALDRDGDGIVQEGTKFERKAKPKAKAKAPAKPKKKTPAKAKPKATVKAKPKKK